MVPLVLPSLRERRADIAVLAQYFADEFSLSYQRPPQKLPDDVINRLYAWHWPGNIRELRNVIEYIFVMRGEAAGINASHLPPYLLTAADGRKSTMMAQPRQLAHQGKQAERDAIENVIQRFGSSVEGKKQAATELGISIATLYRKIKLYGL